MVIKGRCFFIQRQLPDKTWQLSFQWVSNSSGDVEYNLDKPLPPGLIWYLETNPTGSPTDQYDITLLDGLNYDVLQNYGANRSGTSAEQKFINQSLSCVGPFSFRVANAGSTKSGIAIITLMPLDKVTLPAGG